MAHISIEYKDSGLNSKRLILESIIDIVEGTDGRGIVEISPEMHLEDVLGYMQDLTYKVDAEIMESRSLKDNSVKQYISAFIKE